MPSFCLSICLLLSSTITSGLALPDSSGPGSIWYMSNSSNAQVLITTFRHLYPNFSHGKLSLWEMVQLGALASIFPCIWYFRKARNASRATWSAEESESTNIKGRKSVDINGVFLNLLKLQERSGKLLVLTS
jgi:hypothetical protein